MRRARWIPLAFLALLVAAPAASQTPESGPAPTVAVAPTLLPDFFGRQLPPIAATGLLRDGDRLLLQGSVDGRAMAIDLATGREVAAAGEPVAPAKAIAFADGSEMRFKPSSCPLHSHFERRKGDTVFWRHAIVRLLDGPTILAVGANCPGGAGAAVLPYDTIGPRAVGGAPALYDLGGDRFLLLLDGAAVVGTASFDLAWVRQNAKLLPYRTVNHAPLARLFATMRTSPDPYRLVATYFTPQLAAASK